MKKFVAVAFIAVLILSIFACDDGGGSCSYPFSSTGLALDTPINGTIESYGTNFYTFQASVFGTYEIRLTNLTSNCDWAIFEYISNCGDDYLKAGVAPLATGDYHTDPTSEIGLVNLDPGKYLIVVDEWDNPGSDGTYTIQIVIN